jgi:hypothetical protein
VVAGGAFEDQGLSRGVFVRLQHVGATSM